MHSPAALGYPAVLVFHALQQPFAVLGGGVRVPGERLELRAGADGGTRAPHVEGPVHAALVDLREVARHAGDPSGDRQDRRRRARSTGNERLAKPIATASIARDRVAGEDELHGAAEAEQHGVVLPVRRAHHAHDRIADLGVVGDVDEVAGRRELGRARRSRSRGSAR